MAAVLGWKERVGFLAADWSKLLGVEGEAERIIAMAGGRGQSFWVFWSW